MRQESATITAEGPPTDIIEAHTEQEIAAVCRMLREFAGWCRRRYANRAWQVDRYFDSNAWEAELESLGERYAPPDGALLMARRAGRGAGCLAVRQLGGGAAEMKYLFVRPSCQGLGLGRQLTETAARWARAHRCRTLRCEAGDLQHEALNLYESLGFQKTGPDREVPKELAQHLVFLQTDL